MATRFDLEEKIMAAWTSVDDLKLLTSYVEESRALPLHEQTRILEIIDSISTISTLRFEKLFETFKELCREKFTRTAFDKFNEECDTIPFDLCDTSYI